VHQDGYEEPGDEQQEVGGTIWNVGKVLGQPASFVLSVQQELQTPDHDDERADEDDYGEDEDDSSDHLVSEIRVNEEEVTAAGTVCFQDGRAGGCGQCC